MTVELTMLLYSTILFLLIILVPATDAINKNGPEAMGGARDNLPEPPVFRKRALRLRDNMLENIVMFAAVVLIANAAGVSNENTVLGAQIFFYARVAHAVIYLAGWPWIRPLFWLAGLIGTGMIAWPLMM